MRALLASVLTGLALALMWRLPVADAAIPGLAFIFALNAPSSYYWILLALIPMFRDGRFALPVLGLFPFLFLIELLLDHRDHLGTHYALMSWGLFAFLLGWLLVSLRTAASLPSESPTSG